MPAPKVSEGLSSLLCCSPPQAISTHLDSNTPAPSTLSFGLPTSLCSPQMVYMPLTGSNRVWCHCWGLGLGDSQLPTVPCYCKVGLCFLGLVPKEEVHTWMLGCARANSKRSVGTSTALPEDASKGQLNVAATTGAASSFLSLQCE